MSWQTFYSELEKNILSLPSGLHGVWWNNPLAFKLSFLYRFDFFWMLFFLIFESLFMHMGMGFFRFIIFEVCSASWICTYMSVAKFVHISVTISLGSFLAIPPLSTLSGASVINVISFVIAPQVPKALFTFFQSTFFLLFWLENFYSSIF